MDAIKTLDREALLKIYSDCKQDRSIFQNHIQSILKCDITSEKFKSVLRDITRTLELQRKKTKSRSF